MISCTSHIHRSLAHIGRRKNSIIRYTVFLSAGLMMSSCATLIHQKSVNVYLQSDTDSVKICIGDDLTNWYNTPVKINVERSRNDLNITARKDYMEQQILVKSKLSTAFWLGNLFSGIGYFGYAIDLTNPKRFTYPPFITIDFNSDNPSYRNYRTWLTPEKGLLTFKLSFPEGNYFYLNKGAVYGNAFGFLGISGGLEYYFSDTYCLNMDCGVVTDFILPIPAPVDYFGCYQQSFAAFGDIQLGSDYKSFHYDLGLQYTRTSHYKYEIFELLPDYYYWFDHLKIQNNLGFAFSVYYRISNGFNLGLNYYPSFAAWDDTGFRMHYSHLMFFELIFRKEAFRPGKR